jgi:hypothetical protein
MADKRDVTGVWYGRYRSETDNQDNSFIANLAEAVGLVEGSISEPNDDRFGPGSVRRADVEGRRGGAKLRFIKQYDGSGGFTHAVMYSGKIDAEGTVITGVWQVDWTRGTFTMQREKFDEAELEDEEEVVLTVR